VAEAVALPVAEASADALAEPVAEALPGAMLSLVAVAVPVAVAASVASSWFSCILGYLCVPMQVLWEEDGAIVPQSPAAGAHKNSAHGLLR
jgi:hypothetical protein